MFVLLGNGKNCAELQVTSAAAVQGLRLRCRQEIFKSTRNISFPYKMNAVVIFFEKQMKRFQGVTTHKIKEYDMANLNHVRKFKREHVRKIKNKREHNGLVRLAGWLNGWLIWRERKILLVD